MRLTGDVLKLDLYAILGVSRRAGVDQIRRAYRRRVLQSHPDLNRKNLRSAEREMIDLNVAAWVLTDPDLREQYDRSRRDGGPSHSREWYEQVCYGDTQWVVPPKPPRTRTRSREVAALLEKIRLWPSRTMLRVNEWAEGLSSAQRTLVTALCCVTAALLITYAKPRSLVELFQDDTTQADEAESNQHGENAYTPDPAVCSDTKLSDADRFAAGCP